MASADKIYVDPSALRSLYLHDDRSVAFCAWRRRVKGGLPITRFGRAELVNSFSLAVHRDVIEPEHAQAAANDLQSDLDDGRLILLDAMWRRTLDLASDLSSEHTMSLGTRTLDVLHVASALTLEMTHFVSYDRRQLALARAAHLRVLSP